MTLKQLTRRDLLTRSLAAGAALSLAPSRNALASDALPKPFRIAHLTDMHVQPERRAGEGYLAALASLEKLNPRPDMIVTGGDHIMDSTDADLARSRAQWDVYRHAIAQTEFPVRAVLGNHDIFGWGNPNVPDTTVGYGRALALDQLQMQQPYYAFDAGGWRFIMLDSMSRRGAGYVASLGPEQLDWLRAELQAAAGRHIIVFSHIPILSVCVFFDGQRLEADHWNIPDSWMHRDLPQILDLLDEHNVRVAASGHIHLVDRAEYRGVTFLCNGAVSGNWWKGKLLQFPEGYVVIDLYPDGRFEHEFITYGWNAAADEAR